MIGLQNGDEPQVLVENAERWTGEYKSWRKTRHGNEPRRYAHEEIRETLREETFGKCAYCESQIGHVSYENVEHKKPKSKVPELVCTWTNLTVACPRCNVNKGDYHDEQCPILDPYVDDVETEIEFVGPLALPRGGPTARVSINVLQLNRKNLVSARLEALKGIELMVDSMQRTPDQTLRKAIWSEIALRMKPDAEFAAMVRDFVDDRKLKAGLSPP